MLCLPYKKFSFQFDGDFTLSSGKPVLLKSPDNVSLHQSNDTGVDLWDGEIALSYFLDAHLDLVRGKSVLELGAGSFGLAGIVAKILGASSVTLTDLSYCRKSLLSNALLNSVVCDFKLLDWTLPVAISDHFDLVLAADVVWIDSLVLPLVQTISDLRFRRLLLCHQTRSLSVDTLFFNEIRARGFSVELVASVPDSSMSIFELSRSL
jgi:SAM-dependent methyltransferase